MGFLDFLSVNRYYQMSNAELEQEAAKYKIGGYGTTQGRVIRERIITQLLEKDSANNSRIAIAISVLALIISIIALQAS